MTRENMNTYWDTRYQAEGKIWGDEPSLTARRALEIFQNNNVKKLLVPGSGYGRNTRLFSAAGMQVTGVEISFEACRLAMAFDPATRVFNISALDMSSLRGRYDGLYCFNLLHLFREADRKRFIKECVKNVKVNSPMFFTVFSEKEESYGKGAEVEKNTFESKPGRPVHYFTEPDLKYQLRGMEILETGLMEDQENHGEGPHTHVLRYICIKAAK
jgi:cyclopropane fatty-acyl-phospholipid synthase-like methyltransferase